MDDWFNKFRSIQFYFGLTEKNKFELYTDSFDEFSFQELKNELDEILNVRYISPKDLEDNTIGPRNINAYRKLELKTSSTDG